jgi:hypothetical protein
MKAEEFILALRARLLLQPNVPLALRRRGPKTYRCGLCSKDFQDSEENVLGGYKVSSSTLHPLHCLGCKWNVKSRHDGVAMCLRDMLCKVYGEGSVVREVPLHDGAGSTVVADLQLSVPGGVTKWFDVSIVSPACNTYLLMGSNVEPLTAARSQEAEKRRKYAPVIAAMESTEEQFIPFVLEASGRLGEAAKAFLLRLVNDVGEDRKRQVQDIISFQMRRIQTVIARQNACMTARCQMVPLVVTEAVLPISPVVGTSDASPVAVSLSFSGGSPTGEGVLEPPPWASA